jgi:predicted phage terminase large subunit-like protein
VTIVQQRRIEAQPGPQRTFLATSADLAIYGGAAYGGKTFALLLEPLRHSKNPNFGAVIFRRTYPQVTNEGGLWDTSQQLYPLVGAKPRESDLSWRFPSGASVKFAHLQYEANKIDWQGAQVPLIGWDELTHFTEGQFWYLFGRNRSMCGVRPYTRATCNPDPDSFVRVLIDWWIGEDGFAIPERSGRIRWFVRYDGELHWADGRDELAGRFRLPDGESIEPTSFTFVLSTIYDNKLGMQADPSYLAKLQALPLVERERLLGDRLRGGNWNVRPAAGKVFKRHWFEIVDSYPADARRVRYWDLAATEAKPGKDPDWTAGPLLAEKDGVYFVVDVRRARETPGAIEGLIRQTAELDGRRIDVYVEQEPGSSGVNVIDRYTRVVLKGFPARGNKATGNKLDRMKPLSAAAEAGNVKLVRGPWNEAFLAEAESIPDGAHDDQVDAAAGAFAMLTQHALPFGWVKTPGGANA